MKVILVCLLLRVLPCIAFVNATASNHRELKRIRVIDSDPTPSQLPLDRCVGDCDYDGHCKSGLICFQRTRFVAVPGCSGGKQDGSLSDYCIRKSDVTQPSTKPIESHATAFPAIRVVGNNIFNHIFQLEQCEGDCDDRDDCRGDLVCHQRNQYQPVFGCAGGLTDASHKDYCVYPDSVIPPGERPALPYTSKPFHLKLYWEEGYQWQGETVERKWCMMYNYRGRVCWHGFDIEPCDQDAIYISRCKPNEARQEFTFVHLMGGEEILIRLGGGHNSCFQREGRNIVLRPCDPSSYRQRWVAPNGDFNAYRFEISQKSYKTQCVTQAHHPKEGEVVELHSCRASRSPEHQTSYWNVY